MTFHDTTTDYEQILSAVKEHYNIEEHIGDVCWFHDALHEEIDAYVVKYYYEAKQVVLKYDVFKAISLYEELYVEFEIEETPRKNYLKLYCAIIKDEFMSRYRDELEDMCKII